MNPLFYYSTTIIFLGLYLAISQTALHDRNLHNTQSRWDIAWLPYKIFQMTSNLKKTV